MKENIKKVRAMLKSPGMGAVAAWSRCIHAKVLLICLMTMTGTLLSLGFTMATKSLVDGAVSSNGKTLTRAALMLGLIILSQHAVTAVRARLRVRASSTLQKELQGMFLREVLAKPYAGIKKYHSGDLVNRVFSDVGVVKSGVIDILPNLVNIVVSFTGAAIILITMDWRFVILMILGGALALALVLLFRSPMKRRHKRMQEAEGRLHASAQEMLENIRLIKASMSEERSFARIRKDQNLLEQEQFRQGVFGARMNNSMSLVFDISWLFCMVFGCVNIYRGRLTYGSLAAMIQLIGRIEGPIANAVGIASQAYGVISSAERLMELTGLADEEAGESLSTFDEIVLDETSFRYDDGTEEVLQELDCVIKKGDFAALTGMSGGGKTSLFQLLLGIYPPTSGKISFRSGEKTVSASRGTRRLFAYVPQGNTLFSGTLRENLTMFTDHAGDEEIAAAIRAACLEGLAEEIGLDAVLGERGMGLSEGQAQRVAVARALLGGAPILLLDESTSALDEQTEAKMLSNIAALPGKTCIIVTHRRAALNICDYEMHVAEGRMRKRAIRMKEGTENGCSD